MECMGVDLGNSRIYYKSGEDIIYFQEEDDAFIAYVVTSGEDPDPTISLLPLSLINLTPPCLETQLANDFWDIMPSNIRIMRIH